MTPDRMVAEDVGVTNHAIHLRNLYATGVTILPDRRLLSLERDGNQIKATNQNEYSAQDESRLYDQVVIEAGTVPLDDLYEELVSHSVNAGQSDIGSLIEGRRQPCLAGSRMPRAGFSLFRIGDCVSARGIHAAMLDANRICKEL